MAKSEEMIVESIKGIQAIAGGAMPFVIPVGDSEVIPMHGAEIIELDDGKFLARVFNGHRWIQEVMEVREITGLPTLAVASN